MEARKKLTIPIDLKLNSMIPLPQFIQNDTNILEFTVKDNGVDADLSNITRIVINYKRLDKKVISRLLTATGNTILYEIGLEEMEVPGPGEMELQFFENDDKISTKRFKVNMLASIGTDAIYENTEQLTVLQELFVEVDTVKAETETARQNANSATEAANTAAANAQLVADENKTNWLSPVNAFADIATTYTSPANGDQVQTISDGKEYRFNQNVWEQIRGFSSSAIADLQVKHDQVVEDLAEKVKKDDLFLNVKDLGAKGDGVTDDTAAIQAAFTKGGTIFFPEGTYIVNRPDANDLYILTFAKNLKLFANGNATIKVGNKGNQYFAIIGSSTPDITFISEGMQFDANGIQNPQVIYPGETRLTGIPHYRRNCLWLEIGSAFLFNTEFRDFYGTQVALFWQNRQNVKNSIVKVMDCRFLDIGDEYGEGLHDHSSLYVHKDAGKPKTQTLDVEVTGNVFKAKTVGAPNAIAAIDLGGNHTICSNNIVVGYSTASMIGTLDQKAKAKYHNNIFANVSAGILVWSDTHNGYVEPFDSSDYRYSELEFKNNNILVTPAKFKNVYNYVSNVLTDGVYPRFYCGILLYSVATHKMKSLVIEDNFIQFEHDDTLPTTGYKSGVGAGVRFVKSANTFSIDDVIIKGNTFKNISRIPVHFDTQFIKQMIVDKNQFIDVCLQGRQQVFVITQNGLTENRLIQITDNEILSGNYSMYYFISSANNTSPTDKYGSLIIERNLLHPSTTPIDQYIYLLAKYTNIVTNDSVLDDVKSIYLYRSTGMGTRLSLNTNFANGDGLRDNRLILNRSTFPTVAEAFSFGVGDTIVNTSPAAGGYVGWICNVAGNPGTWKGYGLIQA